MSRLPSDQPAPGLRIGIGFSSLFHKFDEIFTAKTQRSQRVGIVFYPALRGGPD